MESDGEEYSSIPKLPLFSIPPHHYLHEPSGMLTPPLQTTTASVPFRWEEQPGKPLPCTDLILLPPPSTTNNIISLHLPPRLAFVDSDKTHSPTTVLDSRSLLSSSSFRFSKERRRKGQRQGSFDSSSCSGGWSPTEESGGGGGQGQQVLLLGNRQEEVNSGGGGKGLFGSFRMKSCSSKGKGVNGNFTSSSSSEEKKGKRMRRNSSLSKVTRSNFWAAIYEGFKHVVPWKKKTLVH